MNNCFRIMSKQTGIWRFLKSCTISNEKDARNVTVNKNVTPKKNCKTDILCTSTATTKPFSHFFGSPLLQKLCQLDQNLTFPETYFGKHKN